MSERCVCGHERDEHASDFMATCEAWDDGIDEYCECIAYESDEDTDA